MARNIQKLVKNRRIWLFLIALGALWLRFEGINWDEGFHQHPDERMIVMTAEKIKPPSDKPFWKGLLEKDSWLNPRFFAYGNLPIYLLKATGAIASLGGGEKWQHYDQLFILGRSLMVLFDLGSLGLIFKIGKEVWDEKTGLWASFFWASAVLPIQLARFYAVDGMLTFFILLTIRELLNFYKKPGWKKAMRAGLFLGMALATKVSAMVLLSSIALTMIVEGLLLLWHKWRKTSGFWRKIMFWLGIYKRKQGLKKYTGRLILWGALIVLTAGMVFVITQPYTIIDWREFLRQLLEQQRMTRDATVFPYTLQYLGTKSYWYQLKNIFLWGMGPALGGLCLGGTVWYLFSLGKRLLRPGDYEEEAKELILLAFFGSYFLLVGSFAVKFMRYFLPLYPFFIFYGVRLGIWLISKGKKWLAFGGAALLIIHLGWTGSFRAVGRQIHPRVQASAWISENIPEGANLAVEHWDDRLPLFGGENYEYLEMPLYESDWNLEKWEIVAENLERADYIILASNRLYTPLLKLTDCVGAKRCYPETARYYQNLFAGNLGFDKVAEFSAFPRIPFWGWEINDQGADESFTVYDHPLVTIFKKGV